MKKRNDSHSTTNKSRPCGFILEPGFINERRTRNPVSGFSYRQYLLFIQIFIFRSLPTNNCSLSNLSPVVITQLTGRTNDTMTWNKESYGILTDSRSYSPTSLRVINTCGYISISSQSGDRDFSVKFPRPLVESQYLSNAALYL